MLVIRLNRTGRKNRSFFRLAVQQKTIAPGGRHVEIVGTWDPHKKVATVKAERITYWLSQGAQPSDTVYNLLVSQGVVEGKKRSVKMERPAKKEEISDKGQGANDKKEEKKEERSNKEQATSDKEEKTEEVNSEKQATSNKEEKEEMVKG